MNSSITKRLGLEMVIVCGIVVVGYELLVMPARTRAELSRAQMTHIENEKHQLGELDERRETAAQDRYASLVRHAEQINALSRESSEPSHLYERFQQAAATSGVRLDRIDPSTQPTRMNAGNAIDSSGYTLGLSGSYPQVIDFIDTLQREFALTTILSVRMVPDPSRASGDALDRVAATIETVHVRMTRPIETRADAIHTAQGGRQ